MSRGINYGIGAGALWGLVFLAPELVRAFAPLQIAIGRYLCYGVLSIVMIWPRRREIFFRVNFREWRALFWLSIAGNTLYYILLSNAVHQGGIAMTSLVIGFLPVAVTIIGSQDSGAIPLRKLAPSLILCAGGAICIGWEAIAKAATGTEQTLLTGLFCAIAALASWTCYAVGNQRYLTKLDNISAQEWNLLTGIVTGGQALVMLPLALMFVPETHHDTFAWLQLGGVSMGLAIFASLTGNALWNKMSKILPLTLVGQMILFETLFALIYGFIWEQRLPHVSEIAAFIFVVTSVTTCIAAHQNQREVASSPA